MSAALRRCLLALALALSAAGAAAEAPLGRLFFTPQERADLDSGKTRTTADAALAPPPTLDGVVRRSDGRGTVWINGKPEQRRVGATLRTPVQDAAGNWSTPKVGETAGDKAAGPAIRIQRGDR